jgi:hypothetical protein
MLWLQKSRTESVETASPVLHFKMDRLAAVEVEFRQAEKVFNDAVAALEKYRATHLEGEPFTLAGKLFVPVNRKPNHQLQILEHEKWRSEFKRNELLAERASLRHDLGIC